MNEVKDNEDGNEETQDPPAKKKRKTNKNTSVNVDNEMKQKENENEKPDIQGKCVPCVVCVSVGFVLC